jgi:hypothetical protein
MRLVARVTLGGVLFGFLGPIAAGIQIAAAGAVVYLVNGEPIGSTLLKFIGGTLLVSAFAYFSGFVPAAVGGALGGWGSVAAPRSVRPLRHADINLHQFRLCTVAGRYERGCAGGISFDPAIRHPRLAVASSCDAPVHAPRRTPP